MIVDTENASRIIVDALGSPSGRWICSYSDLPDGLVEYHVVSRDETHFTGDGRAGSAKCA